MDVACAGLTERLTERVVFFVSAAIVALAPPPIPLQDLLMPAALAFEYPPLLARALA